MTFPSNSKTCTNELVGPSSYTCEVAGEYTILAVKMMQSGTASNTQVACGTSVIAKNYAKDYEQTYINYDCNNTINMSKTGNDNSFVQIIYTTTPYALTDTNKLNSWMLQSFSLLIIFLVTIFFINYLIKKII